MISSPGQLARVGEGSVRSTCAKQFMKMARAISNNDAANAALD